MRGVLHKVLVCSTGSGKFCVFWFHLILSLLSGLWNVLIDAEECVSKEKTSAIRSMRCSPPFDRESKVFFCLKDKVCTVAPEGDWRVEDKSKDYVRGLTLEMDPDFYNMI
ncbi:hypothetical protein E5288_WYG002672 [Bos mutus]|uniref:Uncharacterized protein n=1 Tax=Bos mutus TaxID=72004 RepID=A0A6B0S9T0_9CETA|nr:hypothetical protein [Bos mutus]